MGAPVASRSPRCAEPGDKEPQAGAASADAADRKKPVPRVGGWMLSTKMEDTCNHSGTSPDSSAGCTASEKLIQTDLASSDPGAS